MNYYLDQNQDCLKTTLENCEIFQTNKNLCEFCKVNFYVDSGICKAVNLPNCSKFIKNKNKCEFCARNFYLKNSSCIKQSHFFPENCERVSIENEYEKCAQCSNIDISSDQVEILFQVKETCHPKPNGCDIVDSETGKCLQCSQGYSGNLNQECFIESNKIYFLNNI